MYACMHTIYRRVVVSLLLYDVSAGLWCIRKKPWKRCQDAHGNTIAAIAIARDSYSMFRCGRFSYFLGQIGGAGASAEALQFTAGSRRSVDGVARASTRLSTEKRRRRSIPTYSKKIKDVSCWLQRYVKQFLRLGNCLDTLGTWLIWEVAQSGGSVVCALQNQHGSKWMHHGHALHSIYWRSIEHRDSTISSSWGQTLSASHET